MCGCACPRCRWSTRAESWPDVLRDHRLPTRPPLPARPDPGERPARIWRYLRDPLSHVAHAFGLFVITLAGNQSVPSPDSTTERCLGSDFPGPSPTDPQTKWRRRITGTDVVKVEVELAARLEEILGTFGRNRRTGVRVIGSSGSPWAADRASKCAPPAVSSTSWPASTNRPPIACGAGMAGSQASASSGSRLHKQRADMTGHAGTRVPPIAAVL